MQTRNDAIAPWTQLLEQAGSLELLPNGQHLEWDLSAAMRTDTLSEAQAYQFALGGPGPQSQWPLVDEIRARKNLDPTADVAKEYGVESPTTPEPPPPPPPRRRRR